MKKHFITDDETTYWTSKFLGEGCCVVEPKPAQPTPIDWAKQVEHVYGDGSANPSHVRVLAQGVLSKRYPDKTTLVSVTGCGGIDILVHVNPGTGEGRSVKHGIPFKFRNTQVVTTDVSYINFYDNGVGKSVVETFDTRKEADGNDIFTSRDCCIKLEVRRVDGVYSAAASIEAQ